MIRTVFRVNLLQFSIVMLIFLSGCDIVSTLPPVDENDAFGDRQKQGKVEADAIKEASGLVASRKNASVLWTHNDSGSYPTFYPMDENGGHLGRVLLENAVQTDWEDITIGPGPEDGKSYLYLADIGDNDQKRLGISIFRVEEPDYEVGQAIRFDTLSIYDQLHFEYPDGARDAEVIMIDRVTKDIYIVTKREARSRVYVARYPQSTTDREALELLGELDINQATAGDISPSGNEIIIKNYSTIYYWERSAGQTIFEALSVTPTSVSYITEPQGEALCWAADESGYFTVSEEKNGTAAVLYFYPRL